MMLLVRDCSLGCDDRSAASSFSRACCKRCRCRLHDLPGVVLGAAMIALGVHRLSLIARSEG